MKRPLTGLAIVFAAGIWAGMQLPWPVGLAGGLALAALVLFVLASRTRAASALLFTATFVTGLFGVRAAVTPVSPWHLPRVVGLFDQNAGLRGQIISDTGCRSDGTVPAGERMRFVLAVCEVRVTEQWEPAGGRVLVYVSGQRPPQALHYGDRIECSAVLRVPLSAGNPGAFDWPAWLARRHIFFTAAIRPDDHCIVLDRGRGNPVVTLSLQLRERFEHALRLGLEDQPKLAGVLTAMVIGERSEIPEETYADFQRTGVFHVFSVSGLHVGLVTIITILALRLARVPWRWCGLMGISLLALYVFATGCRPGAVRALVMASVWLLGRALIRPGDALNTLAAAALAVLLWNPLQLFEGGFILSFMAVGSLVVLQPVLQPQLESVFAVDPLLPRRLWSRWRERWQSAWHKLSVALACSLAAWAGLLPLMAEYFHLFTPVAILANVLVIPMMGAITALGLLAMAAEPVWPWLAVTFNNANLFLLAVMIRGIEWLGRLPYGHLFVQAPPLWLVTVYYGLILLLLCPRFSVPQKRWACAVVAPATLAALLFVEARHQAVVLTVLDLPGGTAAFLDLPGERNDWLIDGGDDHSADWVVRDFLRAQGVDSLGGMILTRGDKDHAAGLTRLAREIPVHQAAHAEGPRRSPYHRAWHELVRKQKVPLRQLHAGEVMELQEGIRLHVLSPPTGSDLHPVRDPVLVLALTCGPTRVLLTSDAGREVEEWLARSGTGINADILIKGRHPTGPSGTDEFLDAVQPDVVVVAAGSPEGERAPGSDLVDRVTERGVPLYRTDRDGAVSIRFTERGYTIQTWRR